MSRQYENWLKHRRDPLDMDYIIGFDMWDFVDDCKDQTKKVVLHTTYNEIEIIFSKDHYVEIKIYNKERLLMDYKFHHKDNKIYQIEVNTEGGSHNIYNINIDAWSPATSMKECSKILGNIWWLDVWFRYYARYPEISPIWTFMRFVERQIRASYEAYFTSISNDKRRAEEEKKWRKLCKYEKEYVRGCYEEK